MKNWFIWCIIGTVFTQFCYLALRDSLLTDATYLLSFLAVRSTFQIGMIVTGSILLFRFVRKLVQSIGSQAQHIGREARLKGPHLRETAAKAAAIGIGHAQQFKQEIDNSISKDNRVSDLQSRRNEAHALALEEIETNTQVREIWAMAFTKANGDRQKQEVLYVKYRGQQILAHQKPAR